MVSRKFVVPRKHSFFLFGARGTGKSYFVREEFNNSIHINLLDDELRLRLTASPNRLADLIPKGNSEWIIIDEIQKIPALLNQVHKLIEEKKYRFILTGSSTRKLRQQGVNLLACRAFTQHSYPLTALELGTRFELSKALKNGLLPEAYLGEHSKKFLASYIATCIKEEIQPEGIIRNLEAFSRFLESAAFSQGQVLNHPMWPKIAQ